MYFPRQTQRVAFDIDLSLEQAFRARYEALHLPASLTVFRMALMSAGLALDSETLTAQVWALMRQRGRPPADAGTPPANASIAPVRKNAAWQALDRRNAKLQQQKK